jgi:hypothetical protein
MATDAVEIEKREANSRLATRKALAAVKRAEKRLAEAEAALRQVRARRALPCECGCGNSYAIGELKLRVTHWYVEPHGCTGGDYWQEGEWQFVCPTSGALNRLLFHDYSVEYSKRHTVGVAAEPTFKRLYRDLFASYIEVHERRESGQPMYNNFCVDQQRDYYELPAPPGESSAKR